MRVCVVRPAGKVQELMFVCSSGFVLQLPQQNANEMRVLDDNGHLLEHVFITHTSLLQPEYTEKKIFIVTDPFIHFQNLEVTPVKDLTSHF